MNGPASTRARLATERRRLTEERTRHGRNAPWRRRFRTARRKVGGGFVTVLAPTIVRALAATWRVEHIGVENLDAARQCGFVAAIWHGQLLPMLALHREIALAALVSPSDDGSLLAALLERFGYVALRGSSSRRGGDALRAMRDEVRAGRAVVLTPDGPRGPRHTANVGVAWLAAATGRPILTGAIACDRAWRLKSWDRFTIPKPFARIVVTYGALEFVETDADGAQLERTAQSVRDRLLREEAAGCARLGVAPDA